MHFELPPLDLTAPAFRLPPGSGVAELDRFRELQTDLERQVVQGSQSARALGDRMAMLERRIATGKAGPQALLREPRDIRVLVAWWRGNPHSHLDLLPLTPALLDRCLALRPRFSLQPLFGLINLYFEVFDYIPALEGLAATLRRQLHLREGDGTGALGRLCRHRQHLLQTDGPEWVVAMARRTGRTLDTVAAELGIPTEARGRFYECCQQRYYLATLDGLRVGEDHAVLHELARPAVHRTRYREGLFLGHEVIRRLVDKAAGQARLPDPWLRPILAIAGDPRVSVGSKRFTEWWARLDREYTGRVRRWLSRMDLGLFLEVLEDYSNQAGDEMRRMYPARERFLKGLFDADLITDSRLFLSRRADRFVHANYREEERLAYAINSDAERSVFYLNMGGIHVFEGTHNFQFWIYRDLPPRNPAEDYESSQFPIRDLGVGLKERAVRETGEGPFHVAHCTDWQHKVMLELGRLGIRIDPAAVLTREDYLTYRQRYGVT